MASRQVTGARASAVAVGSYESGAVIAAADGDWKDVEPIGMRIDGTDLKGIGPFNAIGRRIDASGATVVPLVAASGARRVGSIPIATDTGTEGLLLLFMARTPLFVEDDLMLLDVLNAHTARAVEREKVLTERTTLVSELQLANAQLAHASAAKSDFLAAMSHELRTPLHAIIGFSELLLTSPTLAAADASDGATPPGDPNVREFAGHIHGAGLHLLELINDVLDLAKVEAGRLDLQLQAFDIGGLVHRTAKTMRPIAARKRITLDIPDAVGIEVEADASRVRQIVFNLLSNAIKFTPAGGHVEVTLTESGGEVTLVVQDSGPGIPAEDQARIFEPFEQSLRPETPRQEGTGLGLALTRQLVEGHGGRIEVHSEIGRGSRFTVHLPRATGRAIGVEAPETPLGDAEIPDDGRVLVLIVEDDPRARDLLAIHLRDAGYGVITATTGTEALAQARRMRPAAVILDVILPELDGWEVLRELKADAATVDIPVVITSVVEEAGVGFALGAVDYLVKPVRRDELLAELRRLAVINGAPPAGVTVLAIDDDHDTLQLYRHELEPAGFKVLTADGGELGLRMARQHAPAAILLDLVMPDLDGFAVAAELQRDPKTRDTPIVVLTSHDVTTEEKARLNGAVREVLYKGPDAAEALLRWLRRVVTRGPRPTGAAATHLVAPGGSGVDAARGAGTAPVATTATAVTAPTDPTAPTDRTEVAPSPLSVGGVASPTSAPSTSGVPGDAR
jgi:signal transduction histidine kinase/DNA-binding response OmpR family regulator